MKNRGLLIAIYGDSGIDVNTELALFFRAYKKSTGKKQKDIKIGQVSYPINGLRSSEALNNYLAGIRGSLSPLEFQRVSANQKREFEDSNLTKMLAENDMVIVKAYTGTSIAYGLTDGLDLYKASLINFNTGLLEPKISIFFDNENFNKNSVENFVYRIDAGRFQKMNAAYRELSKELGWHIIDAGQEKEHQVYSGIFDDILAKVLAKDMVTA